MKKIPALFERQYENCKVIGITDKLTDESLQIVLDGRTLPTVKYDGSACMISGQKLYKRYDAKKGKKVPARHAGITAFEQIHKARRAAELSRTGIKVLVRDGVYYLFSDGHKMSIWSTIDLKPETIGAWLQVLHTIRQERQGKR